MQRLDQMRTEVNQWKALDTEVRDCLQLAHEADKTGAHDMRADIETTFQESWENQYCLGVGVAEIKGSFPSGL